MAFDLTVNGTSHRVDADPQTPLLWVIRDHVGLTGTKFSCGIGRCGACTLHVDGRAIRSCSVPATSAIGKQIATIEGVSPDGSHPIQIAWKEFDTPQCGYCQSGMIMSALALLRQAPKPTDADIDAQVTNACRCSTYHRVRQAIHRAGPSRERQPRRNPVIPTNFTLRPIGSSILPTRASPAAVRHPASSRFSRGPTRLQHTITGG